MSADVVTKVYGLYLALDVVVAEFIEEVERISQEMSKLSGGNHGIEVIKPVIRRSESKPGFVDATFTFPCRLCSQEQIDDYLSKGG